MRNFIFTLLLLFPFITCCANGNGADTLLNDNDGVFQKIVIPPMPQEASFAGEEMPLDYFDVYESLQRELITITHWHGSFIYIMQLAGRHQAFVEKILKEEGMHPDFFYLCVAESSLQPTSSPANAKGYWQFLATTGKEFGLEIGQQVDERYNWEKSTRAACKYLKKAYEKYGTWTLAAASYNVGMANIDSRIGYQSLKNYYDMQLPLETARYIYRAVALKTIMNNPEAYGFYINKDQLYKPIECKEVIVKESIANWSDFAAKHNTNFKMIKMLNEWIRSNKLDNKYGKTYKVLVPIEGAREKSHINN
ncbi:MAG: lytic transglycosylase domain-containing protein [Bacteroidales bacterium]|nr:lytic transglycosylase domain-containing protein [Bacteroidales bacterium]